MQWQVSGSLPTGARYLDSWRPDIWRSEYSGSGVVVVVAAAVIDPGHMFLTRFADPRNYRNLIMSQQLIATQQARPTTASCESEKRKETRRRIGRLWITGDSNWDRVGGELGIREEEEEGKSDTQDMGQRKD